jgi:hypothetical protein
MKNGTENVGNGAGTDDRFGTPLAYRGLARREVGALTSEPADTGLAHNGSVLDSLAEPIFPPTGWLDTSGTSFADHPLLRGLLLELPPKGTAPDAAWLDRWFEAARSILELLYVQSSGMTLSRR